QVEKMPRSSSCSRLVIAASSPVSRTPSSSTSCTCQRVPMAVPDSCSSAGGREAKNQAPRSRKAPAVVTASAFRDTRYMTSVGHAVVFGIGKVVDSRHLGDDAHDLVAV